ncbi:MAG: DUF362 domain-containing protein [Candidatus Methanofastidiosia archaeon]
MPKFKVYVARCEDYDPLKISKIIKKGMKILGVKKIKGKVIIKSNLVSPHPIVAPSGFTRPEVLSALISLLDGCEIKIVEKSGIGVPTAKAFKHAGYDDLRKKGVELKEIELSEKMKVTLEKGEIHREITVPKYLVENDFLIYTPKFKTNVLVQGMSGALKLNIGILCDDERIWEHNMNLDKKIVDLYEVGKPDLIVTDAIDIGMGGNQFTQHKVHLGIIIMATNSLAHDVVQAEILNLKPENINHLKIANERGYGPISLDDIEVLGDVALEDLKEITKKHENGYKRVDELSYNLDIRCGEPYCVGGCNGVFLDWIYMIKDRRSEIIEKLPNLPVVIGEYEGDVEGFRMVYIGDCAKVKGRKPLLRVRIKGCPPAHRDIILKMWLFAGIRSPLVRVDTIYDSYVYGTYVWLKRKILGV